MYYIVYDNFLPQNEYGILKEYLLTRFPWRFSRRINNADEKNDDCYFATTIFHSHNPAREQWDRSVQLDPFFFITSKLHVEGFQRIKANLYFPTKTKEVYHHAKHRDGVFKHQGALFYLTTCDAPTTMADGYEVESVENRLLLFDPTTPHSSSSPTNASHRITINFNYFGAGVRMNWRHDMPNPNPVVAKNMELLEKSHFLDIANQAMTEWGI
tara:strand:- start:2871 stop:3509 length:639 start_codon:yes stop_codon:yes gene_type:complete